MLRQVKDEPCQQLPTPRAGRVQGTREDTVHDELAPSDPPTFTAASSSRSPLDLPPMQSTEDD